MASRHHSLNLSEVTDVTDLLLAFEEHNQVVIKMGFELQKAGKGTTLLIGVTAWEHVAELSAQKPLASVSVTCSAMNVRTMRDAVTHALYVLDAKLAWQEMEGNGAPSA